jgi:hypothetical protein
VLLLLVGGVLSAHQVRERQPTPPTQQDGSPSVLPEPPTARQEEDDPPRAAAKVDRLAATRASARDSRGAGEMLGEFDEGAKKGPGAMEKLPDVPNPLPVTTATVLGLRVPGTGRADPSPVPPAGAEDGVARAEPEETRRGASSRNTLVFGSEAGRTEAGAGPEGETVSGAAVRSGHRFVHPVTAYSITPPAGFRLVRIGQRTVWQGPEGTQLLVETTLSPGPSARSGWEQLHTTFVKKYAKRYRSHGITETSLAGRPAAAWEFALTTAAGTRYKRDVAVLDRGVGYGILVSAPPERFAAWWPQFETALQSFRLPLEPPGTY